MSIDPINVIVPVLNDTQSQTIDIPQPKTVGNLKNITTQTAALAVYDVYDQAGAALCDLKELAIQVQTTLIDEEAQTNLSPLLSDSDDLADVFFDSSDDSFSVAESPSLPMIMEEDEEDANFDEIWIDDQTIFNMAEGTSMDEEEEPPWLDFDPSSLLSPGQAQGGNNSDSGVETGVDCMMDSGMKAGVSEGSSQTIEIEKMNRFVQTALPVHPEKKEKKQGLGRFFKHGGSQIFKIDQATVMDDYIDYMKEAASLIDREVQTTDSYLKIARGLTRLSRNRAASLKIMAAPMVRRNRIAEKLKRLEDKGIKS